MSLQQDTISETEEDPYAEGNNSSDGIIEESSGIDDPSC